MSVFEMRKTDFSFALMKRCRTYIKIKLWPLMNKNKLVWSKMWPNSQSLFLDSWATDIVPTWASQLGPMLKSSWGALQKNRYHQVVSTRSVPDGTLCPHEPWASYVSYGLVYCYLSLKKKMFILLLKNMSASRKQRVNAAPHEYGGRKFVLHFRPGIAWTSLSL